jgi:hypothetical protein
LSLSSIAPYNASRIRIIIIIIPASVIIARAMLAILRAMLCTLLCDVVMVYLSPLRLMRDILVAYRLAVTRPYNKPSTVSIQQN